MPSMTVHLADLSNVARYAVRIEFTEPLEPYLLAQEMPYVSLLEEIDANSLTSCAAELRKELGRIPYSSPLYWWESYSEDDILTCEYIGQTVNLTIQKRLEQHRSTTPIAGPLACRYPCPSSPVPLRPP